MTAADWTPITNAIIGLIGLLMTAAITTYVPRALAAFEKRTGVQVTAQQTAAFLGAAMTVKGLVENKLNQGKLRISDIEPDNATIKQLADEAIARIPLAAAGINSGAEALATIAASQVNTGPAPAVVVAAPG